ncbi:lysine transporter LysE [Cellvibrio zantedeschiae]|uniref:Lysine transporter LysE n=1 Tax=Cellvibrio zantedeschiae TaxID=1237077 RepID=A0ABQ3B8K6_9GAMM|nr:LysE family translocator [Cellvibrio zantedeschiae]GGY83503.1 lysine transporter LysE [Cellvibrio zantedeschiae]
MSLATMLSLFVALVILAAIPGPGVFTVVARSIASGFAHGLITVFGIVFGDYVFILLSLYGLSALATTMGGLFTFIKYAGAAYLIWLGLKLLLAKPDTMEVKPVHELSFFANFTAGLVTTLSNPKAILFYASFFPAFVNVQQVTPVEIGKLLLLATLAVGSVMAAYAYTASKASTIFKNAKTNTTLNITAGSVILGSGVLIATKT